MSFCVKKEIEAETGELTDGRTGGRTTLPITTSLHSPPSLSLSPPAPSKWRVITKLDENGERKKGRARSEQRRKGVALRCPLSSPLLSPLSHCSTKGCKQIMTAKPIVAAASSVRRAAERAVYSLNTHAPQEREREKREARHALYLCAASLLSPSHLMMAFSPTYRASHVPPVPDAPPLRLAHFLPVVVFAVTSFSCRAVLLFLVKRSRCG